MKPNFFIIGAPKCATSAMYTYLRGHPDIFMPSHKELHFFGSDIRSPIFVQTLDEYLAHFAGASGERRVGEAAVWYLYSRKAAAEIKAFCPGARVIAMLRNPVDMTHSYHSQRVYNGNEDIRDFQAALAAEPDRKAGRRMPASPYPVHGLFYSELARYGEQLARYLEVFDRDAVHVVIYEDLRDDPEGEFKAVLRFLGVDDAYCPEFRKVNPSRRVRSEWVRDRLLNPPPVALRLGKAALPAGLRRGLYDVIKRLNVKYEGRASLPPAARRALWQKFEPDVERLSKLLDRDLVATWRPLA